MTKNRTFSLLPPYFQTDTNKRSLSVVDDVLFEPTSIETLTGQIGISEGTSASRLASDPFIPTKKISQQNQLSPCVITRGAGNAVEGGVFYQDIARTLEANGADVSDLSRLFETDYFVLNVPIDIDMWTNFSRYYWTGPGTSSTLAEYITKDPIHTQGTVYLPDGDGGWTKLTMTTGTNTFPSSPTTGDLYEYVETSDPGLFRRIVRWDGSDWVPQLYTLVDELPLSSISYTTDTVFYPARYGQNYQRTVFAVWSPAAQRWVIQLAVHQANRPENPVEGMIWEDATSLIDRVYRRYVGGEWVSLAFDIEIAEDIDDTALGFLDAPAIRILVQGTANADPWSIGNWWRHYDDLSPVDQITYASNQAFRPIISFWPFIETLGDVKSERHQNPLFETYSFDENLALVQTKTLTPIYNGSSIFEYKRAPGASDTVLGFTPVHDTRGEITFDLTLESQVYASADPEIKGYRFFKDTSTGKYWSAWMKSPEPLVFNPATDAVPPNMVRNPDHSIETHISRSNIVEHYQSVIGATATGAALGSNNYRWTTRDPVSGASIIDAEGSLLKLGFSLTNTDYDIAEAIREASRHYSRFFKRFARILTTLWSNGQNSNPNGTLISGLTAANLVDRILTNMYVSLEVDRPYNLSGMGTYVNEITGRTLPIVIPPSPPRLGVAPLFQPLKFKDQGQMKILCHDGRVMDAWGDARDTVILNLEQRFFDAMPAKRRVETVDNSAWLDGNGFDLKRFVGHHSPQATLPTIDLLTADYTQLTPTTPASYFSTKQNVFAYWNGSAWSLQNLPTAGVFFITGSNQWRVINDYGTTEIRQLNGNNWVPDYSITEFKSVIYREFEHWRSLKSMDPTDNTTYDSGDRFTWNYRTSGNEGHYKAIYQRVYGTTRPHTCPWEIWGFSIKPQWWNTYFTADETDADDGLGRWHADNDMWVALADPGTTTLDADGIIIPENFWMRWDAPVDAEGELIDPVTLGFITLESVIAPSADWRYGDSGPVEQAFLESAEGVYSTVLAAYLMKPSRVVDRLWSDYMFAVGDDSIQGGKFLVDDSTLRRSSVATQAIHTLNGLSDPGIGALIVDRLRLMSKSIDTYMADLRSSEVTIGWRTEGFVDKKTMAITTMAGKDIPQEDISLVVHKGLPTSIEVHSGVYVIKIGSQYQVFGYDFSTPHFTLDVPARPIRGGQVILDQRYTITNPTNTVFTLTEFAVGTGEIDRFYVILNGERVDSGYVKVLDRHRFEIVGLTLSANDNMTARLHTTTGNASTRVKSFKIDDFIYTYNDTSSNDTSILEYGSFLNSEQEVVQFLADYGRYLGQRGWTYPNTNWIDEAKRFAAWTQTAGDLEILVMCPSAKQLEFVVPHGHVDDLSTARYGGPPVLDLSASPAEDLTIMRLDDRVTIITKDGAYLIRLAVVEYQHAAIMSATTRFNDVIYDPFTGSYHKRLFVDALRIKDWRGRLETPGYVLSDDGLNMNFETAATEFVNAYDTRSGAAVSVNKTQALGLYNFAVKSYMRQFHLDMQMSFDYHKRAIQEKGTTRALMAFANVKTEQTPLEIRECWAWHLASYGHAAPVPFTIGINATGMRNRRQLIAFGDEDNVIVNAYLAPGFDASNDPSWLTPPMDPAFDFSKMDPSTHVSLISFDETNLPFEQFFEWHPATGKHDPVAYREIDIEAGTDPALYSVSPITSNVTGDPWGPEKVGTIWWNTATRKYADYANFEEIADRALRWGDLSYLVMTSVTDADYGFSAVTETAHGFTTDSTFYVKTKQGDTYQAIVLTVPTTTSFTFVTMDGPEATDILANAPGASDFDRIVTGSIDVYQWIESALSPTQYADIGQPYNAANPSWTQVTQPDGTIKYYYWVKNGGDLLGEHKIGLDEITRRLIAPASSLSPWFCVIDPRAIMIDTAALGNRPEYSLQFVFTPRLDKQHNEWLLIPEGDTNWSFPDDIKSKIYASVVGADVNGRETPSNLLPLNARIGNGRQQTLFRDRVKAREEFLLVLNRMLKSINRFVSPNFVRAFEDGGDYWTYVDFDSHGREVSERVYTVAQRDALIDLRTGDCVKVDNVRVVDGDQLYESYAYTNGVWTTIQAELGAAEVNDNLFDDFYGLIGDIEDYIGNANVNTLLFALLYEMMRQTDRCDWFFKTSYVDIRLSLETGQPDTVGRDEFELIRQNIDEFKPFHTKVRRYISSQKLYNGDEPFDAVSVDVSEDHTFKTAMYIDRLSCNLFDDHTFDMEPFDMAGFDQQPWEYDLLGTDEWAVVGAFEGEAATKRYPVGILPRHNDYRLLAYDAQGQTISPSPHQFEFDGDDLFIVFTAFPPLGNTYVVEMTRAMVSDNLLETVTTDTALSSSKSTWLHAAAANRITVTGVHNNRVVSAGSCGDLNDCGDCNSADGGDSEERVRTDADDFLFFRAETYSTDLYGGFDATPFDVAPLDQKLGTHDVRSFYSVIAPEGTASVSTTSLVTSTSFTVDSDYAAFGIFQAPQTYYTITHIRATLGGNAPRILSPSEWSLETNYIANIKTGLSIGDTIVLLYGEIQLYSQFCNFEDDDIGYDYDIVDGNILKFDGVPPVGGSVTVVYDTANLPKNTLTAKAGFAKYSHVVDEVLADHIVRQGASVVNIGYSVLNSTDKKVYTWNGTTWDNVTLAANRHFYDRAAQTLKSYNGTTISVVDELADGMTVSTLPGGAPSSSVVGNFGSAVPTEYPGSFGLVHRIAPDGFANATVAFSDASLKTLDINGKMDMWADPVTGLMASAYGATLPEDQPTTSTLMSGVRFHGIDACGMRVQDNAIVGGHFLSGGTIVVGFTVDTIANAEAQTLVSKFASNKGYVVQALGTASNQFTLDFYYYYDDGTFHRIRSAGMTLIAGKAYFARITYNAATQAYTMSINGTALTPTEASTPTLTATTAVSTTLYLGNESFSSALAFNGVLHLVYFGTVSAGDSSAQMVLDYVRAAGTKAG